MRRGMTEGVGVRSRLGMAATAVVVIALAVLTWRQAGFFRDEETLWDHTIAVNPRAWAAYSGRGVTRNSRGQLCQSRGDFQNARLSYDLALADFTDAISLKPDYAPAYSNRGYTYTFLGDFERAIADLTRAIDLKPDFPAAYSNRGNAYGVIGDFPRALADLDAAIRLRPEFAVAYGNRAATFFHMGQYDKAWADLKECRRFGGTPNPELVRLLQQATGRSE
jgi:tetratricopeptide (TPR) repeat protein